MSRGRETKPWARGLNATAALLHTDIDYSRRFGLESARSNTPDSLRLVRLRAAEEFVATSLSGNF
jgi:hypothetical protein